MDRRRIAEHFLDFKLDFLGESDKSRAGCDCGCGANRDLGLKFVDMSITVLGGTVDVGRVAALGKLYV